jgi:hypothetical protein
MGLKGANSDVIDAITATTMYWAVFYRDKGLDLYSVVAWISQRPMMALEINQAIKANQKAGNKSSVPGLMVWLHTVRAAEVPEIRHHARLIWNELGRATSAADFMALEMLHAVEKIGPVDYERVPIDFESVR